MKNFTRHFIRFLAILILGVVVFFAVERYRYYQSPAHEAERYFDDLRARYEADTYGGATPEETLQLFVDALKKGDIDLASKYFVVEKREEWKTKLVMGSERDTLGLLILEVEARNEGKAINNESYLYTVVGKDGIAKFVISLVLNSNNRWKIEEL